MFLMTQDGQQKTKLLSTQLTTINRNNNYNEVSTKLVTGHVLHPDSSRLGAGLGMRPVK